VAPAHGPRNVPIQDSGVIVLASSDVHHTTPGVPVLTYLSDAQCSPLFLPQQLEDTAPCFSICRVLEVVAGNGLEHCLRQLYVAVFTLAVRVSITRPVSARSLNGRVLPIQNLWNGYYPTILKHGQVGRPSARYSGAA
jgi:hypothetical protein